MPKTVEVFDGVIADMRSKGYTLQNIGNVCGVSRERIRQILNEHYPQNLYPDLLTTEQMAKELGMRSNAFVNWIFHHNLKPAVKTSIKYGRHLWHKDQIPYLLSLRKRFCRICKEPIPFGSNRITLCSDKCYRKSMRLIHRSPEAQTHHRECVKNWQIAHPERWREIQRKALNKYSLAKTRNRIYTIRSKYDNTIPIGELVHCVGNRDENRRMPVFWRGKIYHIPIACLKIVGGNERQD